MDELVGGLATNASIDNVVTEKISGIVLDCVRDERAPQSVQGLIDRKVAIAASQSGSDLSRLVGGAPSAFGTRLMSPCAGISDVPNITRELSHFGRDTIGADRMGRTLAGTPGLGQFA